MDNDHQIITAIEHIRKRNNELWMDILRTAMESNKQKTKELLKKINENDKMISSYLEELAE